MRRKPPKPNSRGPSLVRRLGRDVGTGIMVVGVVGGALYLLSGGNPSAKNLSKHMETPVSIATHAHEYYAAYDFIEEFKDTVVSASKQYDVPPEMIAAMIVNENYGRPKYENWKDNIALVWNKTPARLVKKIDPSLGPGQINVDTAYRLSQEYDEPSKSKRKITADLQDPKENIRYVAMFLHHLVSRSNRQTQGTNPLDNPHLLATVGSEYLVGESSSQLEDALTNPNGRRYAAAIGNMPYGALLGDDATITDEQQKAIREAVPDSNSFFQKR